ncbi:MAG: class I SAM-dependent methyltransferase, partial [Patescibacteria group bacterium]|nr:class I SAM-dependent methyltransferase [Patescibacteria group bacterium]
MDLLKLNRQFYLKTQVYFNRSRQFYWDGWQKLLPYLTLRGRTSQVLDLGCGNGRFGKFLAEHKTINYTGMDNNQYLLDRCDKALPQAKLIKHDLTKPWPIKDKFDLVAILGVMHHMPQSYRLPILQRAVANLKLGGILFLSFWEFNRSQE